MSTKEFITTPNIPNKRSKAVLVDYRIAKESVQTLHSLGITVYFSTPVNTLYPQVKGHPDMQLCHVGKNKFVAAPSVFSYYQTLWPKAQILKGKTNLSVSYPRHIAYNAGIVGDHIFHFSNYTDPIVKKQLSDKTAVSVRQGYSKCNICIVANGAIITSDPGIVEAAQKYHFDVLKIHHGFIKLFDMEGFLGGSCGLLAPDLLAVNGDIHTHKDADAILSFCKNYKVELCPLKKGCIDDIGSILPIVQEK